MPEDPENKNSGPPKGISRRGFLSSVSAGAVVAVSLKGAPAAPAQEIEAFGETVTVDLKINGSKRAHGDQNRLRARRVRGLLRADR
jgi:hypothetical protein